MFPVFAGGMLLLCIGREDARTYYYVGVLALSTVYSTVPYRTVHNVGV